MKIFGKAMNETEAKKLKELTKCIKDLRRIEIGFIIT